MSVISSHVESYVWLLWKSLVLLDEEKDKSKTDGKLSMADKMQSK